MEVFEDDDEISLTLEKNACQRMITFMSNLHVDLMRFTKSQEWHKILTLEGVPYMLFPFYGMQPKTIFERTLHDADSFHWWFYPALLISDLPIHDRGKEIIMQNCVNFNIFLRGLESNQETGETYYQGWGYVRKQYSSHAEEFLKKMNDNDTSSAGTPHKAKNFIELVYSDQQRQIALVKQKAKIIFELLLQQRPECLDLTQEEAADFLLHCSEAFVTQHLQASPKKCHYLYSPVSTPKFEYEIIIDKNNYSVGRSKRKTQHEEGTQTSIA